MNLTSVNLAPSAPSNKAIEGDGPALPENSPNPKDFANTLKGQQENLSNKASTQTEPPAQPASIENEVSVDVKQISTNNQEELVALLEKYLPPAAKVEQEVTETGSPLLNLAGELIAAAAPATTSPVEVTVQPSQDIGGTMAMTGLVFVKPAPEEAKAKVNVSIENAAPIMPQQRQSAPAQTTQVSQALNLDPKDTDNAEAFKLSLATVQGPETAVTDVKTEFLPIPKPVETRLESAVITKPMTHPGWGKDLGEHILWMNSKDISAAEIKLNPLHLGPISVRIDVNEDNQTAIFFTAQHTETKEAIEASIPRLREMLQGQQLNLVNVNISQNSHSNQGRSPSQPFYHSPGKLDPNLEANPSGLENSSPEQIVSKGLLSLYA